MMSIPLTRIGVLGERLASATARSTAAPTQCFAPTRGLQLRGTRRDHRPRNRAPAHADADALAAWHTLARLAELLPSPPLTRNQVELMEVDSVASPGMPGFAELGISPRSIEDILPEMVRGH
jgi:hypothetical protein